MNFDSQFSTSQQNRRVGALEVFLLGKLDFYSCIKLQERLAYEIAGKKDDGGCLLLCEHPPTISMGREASQSQLRCDIDELKALQIKTHWINRGGAGCVHVPGQLGIYPILPLNRLSIGPCEYRNRLEKIMQSACTIQKVDTFRKPQFPGLFARGGQIGWVGAAIRFEVAYHGCFLNVSPSLDRIRLLKSVDGSNDVSSLSAELATRVSMNSVRESVIQSLADSLGYDRVQLHTRHPLLKRTRQKVIL